MSNTSLVREALSSGEGVVRLAPCWVPRSFLVPGGRLRLDPRDLYAAGAQRGGIDERWLASTTRADNGPGTPEDEGLSFIATTSRKVPLKFAMDTLGDDFLGSDAMREQGGWNVLAKFFDNRSSIPFHMHQRGEHAARVGRQGKHEAYYFPPQLNAIAGDFPYSFLGLNPGTTKDDVRQCLERWAEGENGILYHSRAYKLRPGTGWQIHAGILHAPGSLVTYEVQQNSDVGAFFQSMADGQALDRSMLVKDVPAEQRNNLEYLVDMLDWPANVDADFATRRLFWPVSVQPDDVMADCGYSEKWISYSTPFYSAKELTVFPGRHIFIRDAAAYGLIVLQGWGTVGRLEIESPTVIRYGQMTKDELFVTAAAAKEGVVVRNRSDREDLVMLKHFGPGNPEAEALIPLADAGVGPAN